MSSCFIDFIPSDTFTCLTWVYISLALLKAPIISFDTPSMNNILSSLSQRFYCSQGVLMIDWFSSAFTNVRVGINSKFSESSRLSCPFSRSSFHSDSRVILETGPCHFSILVIILCVDPPITTHLSLTC